jgi:DNA-binding GntR family transcriptional regulator
MLIETPLANVLAVEPGSAGLRLVRQYKSADGRILEITGTCYPADLVSVSFQ